CVSGHDDDLFFPKEACGELLTAETRGADVREAVERAAWLEALEAHVVETLPHVPTAAVVLGHYLLHIGFAVPERLDRRILTCGRYAHHRVLMDLHHLLDHVGRRACVADAPSGHRVRLREAT